MLSKNKIKIISSLNQKKQRKKYGLFVVEGLKSVLEFLAYPDKFILEDLFYTNDFSFKTPKATKITATALKKISFLKNPNTVLAVFKIPKEPKEPKNNGLILALDNIQDPGNLGTIIRLCDWFGVTQLVCSLNTVDCYNEKSVQASMGSLTRLSISYTNLVNYLHQTKLPIYTTQMQGKNVYKETLPKEVILVLGNEANGISDEILSLDNKKIAIPKFGKLPKTESLNVAMATAIFLSEFCSD